MKRLLKTIFVTALFLTAGLYAQAQRRTVTGTVVDSGGNPIPGVGVIQKGTSNGTVTGIDGDFSIQVPAENVVLTLSSLGYVTKDVTVSTSQFKISVILEEDSMTIEETVVVGYGTQKKVNLTGAVTAVESKELENRSAHNLSTMLQGTVPGLNISTSSGNPGSTGELNVRGFTSINGGSPLVLIDGSVGTIDRVNPNDVESISVIKDASAAAVYGGQAAYGVILITTKSAKEDGKATVRYSGRLGWEEPTTSTDYETRGYWSVYTVDKFFMGSTGAKYTTYTDADMRELLARVNDKTENPERPWVMIKNSGGKDRYYYYCNTDWWHSNYNDRHPVQNHSLSVTGGNKQVKYALSGAYDKQVGIIKARPDVYDKVNLRSKIDARINKYARISNTTTFFKSKYDYPGLNSINEGMAYGARHALASFPLQNPDGTWTYATDWISGSYRIANGRHIAYANDNINIQNREDFTNTVQLTIQPVKQFTITGNYTFRYYDARNTYRRNELEYSQVPGEVKVYSNTGAWENKMSETFNAYVYQNMNLFATYEDTFNENHHLKVMAGINYADYSGKTLGATGYDLITTTLSDLDLISTAEKAPEVSGGQSEYALGGYFGRINYDYKERYLLEISGRYDGTSRFLADSRWGFFPSFSLGWRISEEPFFRDLSTKVDNLKLRYSYGTLGNQSVSNYIFLRKVNFNSFASFTFGEGSSMAQYTNLSAPNASDLTWETTVQQNLGLDFAAFGNRLEFTVEGYIRDTKGMLTDGVALPAVYGASSPKMNAADLRTKGYEVSLGYRDGFKLFGKDFGYNLKATLSNWNSVVTKYDNPEKSMAKDHYVGEELGEIWGLKVDHLFTSDEDAAIYTATVDQSLLTGRLIDGWRGGDIAFKDNDGNGKIDRGLNTADDYGDFVKLGNSLARLHYGLTAGFTWLGIDANIFFEGTGNHYWFPNDMSTVFWGPYSYGYTTYLPKNFLDNCWSEDNLDAYFPRPRTYITSNGSGELHFPSDRYLQNIRYLRLKNLTIGYTVPRKDSMKAGLEKVRIYFTGENLEYWSPLKKHSVYVDPEAAFDRDGYRVTANGSSQFSSDDVMNQGYYPWQKTFMFGIDITF